MERTRSQRREAKKAQHRLATGENGQAGIQNAARTLEKQEIQDGGVLRNRPTRRG